MHDQNAKSARDASTVDDNRGKFDPSPYAFSDETIKALRALAEVVRDVHARLTAEGKEVTVDPVYTESPNTQHGAEH